MEVNPSFNMWQSGPTSKRPVRPVIGENFFDTTINAPVWWNGSAWVVSGSGDMLQAFPNRIDLSVNNASVDNAQSASPVMITRTGTNPVGAYNGGGLGNKAILGIHGFNLTPLSALLSVEINWKEVDPAIVPATQPYVNLIVEPDPVGAPGVYRIFAIDNGLCFAATSLGGGRWNYIWHSAPPIPVTGPNAIKVVGPKFPNTFPPVVPYIVNGPVWPSQGFRVSDILAAYPNCRLVDASSGDGGLPKSTETPAVLVVIGDSNNTIMTSRLIEQIKINGILV
jgi:hypothetical protein